MMRIQRNPTHKRAFTLVELLVVMAVLVLLSSLVLSALAGAAEQARENRTRSQIQKIHELLMSRY
ncbi:MAG: prepilin-type N-terminal cleavage/methylation domain-containing protein, partial [Pirellulaceae bacterium]